MNMKLMVLYVMIIIFIERTNTNPEHAFAFKIIYHTEQIIETKIIMLYLITSIDGI